MMTTAKRPEGYWKRYYAENREQRLAEMSEYQAAHKDERRSYNAKYYAANKGKYKHTREQQDAHNATRREKYRTDSNYRAKTKADVQADRKKHPETRFARELKKYNLTIDDYKQILAEQDGKCFICGRDESGDRRGHRFHVDHCHKTGKVRGILCSGCNLGIGKFKDDPELLERAATYLRGYIADNSDRK